MFLSIGILGAWTQGYSDAFLSGQDLLAAVSSSPVSNGASLAASYLFPIVALLSGIPVFSIIIRYNLLENGFSKVWANIHAVFMPWAAALCVYSGSLLNDVTTCVRVLVSDVFAFALCCNVNSCRCNRWSAALSFVLLNFSLPLACYIILRKQEQRKSATLDVSPQGQLDISLPLLHGAAEGSGLHSLVP